MELRRASHRRAAEGGFTLVEVLVAAALAGIGFLGLAATHATAIRTTSVSRATNIATIQAAEQIEILRRTAYDAVTSGAAEGVTVDGLSFSRQVAVAASPTGNSKRVQVTVSWSDQFGPHQVALTTVIAP